MLHADWTATQTKPFSVMVPAVRMETEGIQTELNIPCQDRLGTGLSLLHCAVLSLVRKLHICWHCAACSYVCWPDGVR